ncbi:hypothetical protein V2G26_015750 [Clonostachys chloroleuca]
MTKPASTDGVQPDAPPSGTNDSNDETFLTREGQDVINDHPLSHVTGNKLPNGRVEVSDVPMEPSTDAPAAPATNGHTTDSENVAINGHDSVDKTHDDDERPAKRRRTRDATPRHLLPNSSRYLLRGSDSKPKDRHPTRTMVVEDQAERTQYPSNINPLERSD